MAEIHVQSKKQSSNASWIWIIAALLVAAALVYYLMNRNKEQEATPAIPPAASKLEPKVRPQQPQHNEPFIPVVYMRSV
ncbi:MAG TPA: hypothetical protein VEB40_05620 [Flavipsychrobacter sp.]|nr:hypothetical protein [Flavipsychrobacter sp.]